MSLGALGYVYKHSGTKGTTFAVHMAIADSVNDEYRNRFFLSQTKTATKARVSVRAVRDALNTLVEEGYLREIKGKTHRGGGRKLRQFVFLTPDRPVVYDPTVGDPDDDDDELEDNRQPLPVAGLAEPAATDPTTGSHRRLNRQPPPIDPKGTQGEPKEACAPDAKDDPDRGFEMFWKAYPARDGTKVGKADALREWRKLSYDDKLVAFKAAGVMATRDRFPPDAHRWLRKRTFEDWIESAAPGSTAAPIRYGQLSDDERMRLDQGRRYRDKVLRQIAAGDDSEYDPGPDPGDEAYWAEWERTGILP